LTGTWTGTWPGTWILQILLDLGSESETMIDTSLRLLKVKLKLEVKLNLEQESNASSKLNNIDSSVFIVLETKIVSVVLIILSHRGTHHPPDALLW